jgi:hypothetical protein
MREFTDKCGGQEHAWAAARLAPFVSNWLSPLLITGSAEVQMTVIPKSCPEALGRTNRQVCRGCYYAATIEFIVLMVFGNVKSAFEENFDVLLVRSV